MSQCFRHSARGGPHSPTAGRPRSGKCTRYAAHLQASIGTDVRMVPWRVDVSPRTTLLLLPIPPPSIAVLRSLTLRMTRQAPSDGILTHSEDSRKVRLDSHIGLSFCERPRYAQHSQTDAAGRRTGRDARGTASCSIPRPDVLPSNTQSTKPTWSAIGPIAYPRRRASSRSAVLRILGRRFRPGDRRSRNGGNRADGPPPPLSMAACHLRRLEACASFRLHSRSVASTCAIVIPSDEPAGLTQDRRTNPSAISRSDRR